MDEQSGISITKTRQGIYVGADRKTDRGVWSETRKLYSWMDAGPGDVFMDVGGNIGTVAKLFTGRGCRVVSYEPHPDNCKLFRLNAPDAELHEAAMMPGLPVSGKCRLWLGNIGQTHTVVKTRRRHNFIDVEQRRFESELNSVRPTHLKIDIEGGEYALLEDVAIPDCVRQMCIEFHFRPHKINNPKRMIANMRRLMEQGFAFELNRQLADPQLLESHRWFMDVKFSRDAANLEGEWVVDADGFERFLAGVERYDGQAG